MRVGILGIQHESNTFLPVPTTEEHFRHGALLSGDTIRKEYADSHHELGGFFTALDESDIQAVPLFFAWALPSGTITTAAAEFLCRQLQDAVDAAGELDGLLVAPHGAAVSEPFADFDGHWLSQLREQVGTGVPIIGTLDLHANLSQQMADACNALIAYRTNPHLDQRQRGRQAGELMIRTLRGEIRPVQAAALPAVSINIERQLTSDSPCREMYAFADKLLNRPGVITNSLLLGFPYADVAEMGSAFLVVTDGDRELAQRTVDELGDYLIRHRDDFLPQMVEIDEAVPRALAAAGPACLLDMGDNVGGGSPGDSTFLLHALCEAGVGEAFVCIYDPESVVIADTAGLGSTVELNIGGKTDDRHGAPYRTTATVVSLHEGKFREDQPRHGGRTHYDMGRTAVVRTAAGPTVMLTTRRMVPFSLAQLTSCAIQPAEYKILVAKGVHAPTAAYAPVCPTLLRVNTPGVTTADMQRLDFQNRRSPLFPFER